MAFQKAVPKAYLWVAQMVGQTVEQTVESMAFPLVDSTACTWVAYLAASRAFRWADWKVHTKAVLWVACWVCSWVVSTADLLADRKAA
jgi:hypothetical protein